MRVEQGGHLILNNRAGKPASDMTVRRTIRPKELKLWRLLVAEGMVGTLAMIVGIPTFSLILLFMFIDSNVVRASISVPIALMSFWRVSKLAHTAVKLAREYNDSEDLYGSYRHIDTTKFPILFPLLLAWLAEEYHQTPHPNYELGTSEYTEEDRQDQGEQILKLVSEKSPATDEIAGIFFRRAEQYEHGLRQYKGAQARAILGYAELLAIRTAKELIDTLTIKPAKVREKA